MEYKMSKLSTLVKYLLSESVEETKIDISPELEDDIKHLQHFHF